MKLTFTFLLVVLASCALSAQTLLYSENFETNSLPDSIVYTGTGLHGKSSILFSQGLQSDSMRINVAGDSVVMTTQAFSTTGNSFVMLHFDQICKIEFFDEAYVEVSNDNGASWIRLTGAQYQGLSQFATQGNKFTAAAYSTDWAAGVYAVPANSWWKAETFDISLLIGNAANAKIRFVLRDAQPGNTMPDNYAWFIDNIRVLGAYSELIPPVLTMLPPIVQDTVYSTGPYVVRAHITDQSLIDTAYLVYWVNVGTPDTIGMTKLPADTFSASIPFFGFGKNIHYYVVAMDGSAAHNTTTSSTYHFYCKFSTGGTYTLGTGTTVNTTTGYPTPYGNYYYGSKEQYLILASEMLALGMPGGPISSIAFNVSNVNACPGLNGFYIKMAHTTASALTSFTTSGLNTVYNSNLYQPVVGWNTHTFQTPFVWNGIDNVLIEVCFNNSSYLSNGNASVYQSATAFNSLLNYHTDNTTVCTAPGTPTAYAQRPNMKIEILGVTSLTLDAGVGQIVYPTGGVVANTPFDVKVKVKNYGTDTLLSATVNWRLDGVLQTPYSWAGTLLKDSSSADIILSNITLANGYHTIVAWTDNPNGQPDLNTGNDSSKISFMACASLLSGNYTIGGAGANFPSFSAAVTALEQCGISGPVVFNVAPGTYNEQITIPWISGSSAINTITFQSATPDSTLVILTYGATGTANNYLVQLSGSERIIFRNIKFVPTGTSYATAIKFTNGAKYNTLVGNLFVGATGTTDDLILIRAEGATNTDNLVKGNRLEGGSIGMYFKGQSTAARLERIRIEENVLEGFTNAGIKFELVAAVTAEANLLNSITTNSGTRQGILVVYGADTIKVIRNQMILSNATNTHGIYLENCTSAVGLEGLVANNFIAILSGTTQTYGMRIITTSNWNIFSNSLNITGTSSTDTRGVNTVGSSSNIQVLNNNIQSNKYPTLYEGSSCSRSNYNNLYSTGDLYGFYSTTYQNFTSLAAYKAASQKDTNSVSYIPYFFSNTNLHTVNGLLNGIALPVPQVTNDIDNQPRNATTPDIGADEFDPPAIDVTVLGFTAPTSGCAKTATEPVTILIKNVGSNAVTSGLAANFRFNNSATVVTENISGTINPGDTLQYTFTATVNLDVLGFGGIDSTFALEAWTTLTGDPVPFNDTAKSSIKSKYTPIPPTVTSPVNIPYGTKATLNATSTGKIYWYPTDTSTIWLDTGSVFVTPYLYDTTTFYVAAGGSGQSMGATPELLYYNFDVPGTSVPNLALSPVGTNPAPITGTGLSIGGAGLSGSALQGTGVSSTGGVINTGWATNLSGSFTISFWTKNIAPSSTLWYIWGDAGASTFRCFTNGVASANNWMVRGGGLPDLTITGSATAAPNTVHVVYDASAGQYKGYIDGVLNVTVSAPTSNTMAGSGFQIGGYGSNSNLNGLMDEFRIYNRALTQAEILQSLSGISTSGGCQSQKASVQVNTGLPPLVDAGISAVLNPVVNTTSGTPTPITVELKNFGADTLVSANIVWSLNSVVQDTLPWTGSLPYNQTLAVTVDTAVFAGGTYCIQSWTFLPNGVTDSVNSNDTAVSCFNACMAGTYTIGPSATGTYDFNSFNSALNTLVVSGICGPIVFDVYPGTYTEQVTIPQINGMDINNTVTFRGTGDSTQAILEFSASSTANWTLRLNGADYFRFEKLTIRALNTSYG
ncbi:MAG TPA: hypothetical protein P5338_11910, partial [Bacteroidales bacterium]|nr:hypothetical protein [Bacteroidales bacterium]